MQDVAETVRQAMSAGIAQYRSGNLEQARGHFLRAWHLEPSRGIAAALAEVEMQLERYVDAAAYWRYFIEQAEDEAGRSAAKEKLAECLDQLGRVRVQLDDAEGARLSIGGRTIEGPVPSEALLVEPGSGVLRVERPGYRPHEEQFVVEAGEVIELWIRLEPEPAAARGSNEPRDLSTAGPEAQTLPARTAVLVGGATLTTVAVVMGVVLALKGSAEYRKVDGLRAQTIRDGDADWAAFGGECHSEAPDRPASCDELRRSLDEGHRDKTWARTAYLTGGALGVVTLAAWLLWPTSSPGSAATKDTAWSLEPWNAPDAQGLQLSVGF